MGYKEFGILVNKANGLLYQRSDQTSLGVEYHFGKNAEATIEVFIKNIVMLRFLCKMAFLWLVKV